MNMIYRALAELEEKGEGGVLCTIVGSQGSTPRHEGSKLLLYPDGHFIGSVGGGEVEGRVIKEAAQALNDGKTRRMSYAMVDPQQGDPGVCGGTVEVFIEPLKPKPTLLVVGGGHVGKAIAHLAHWLGFKIGVSDDRPEFCTSEANPDADFFVQATMAEIPTKFTITPYTYIVLPTRNMGVDVKGLPALLETKAGYIGLIGSRRRWALTKKALLEAGVPKENMDRINAPMGLELKAETPEEIAVSIMAEILMLRNGGTGQSMKIN
jgi:xanthine dehydrogenase accessory factor